MKTINSFISLCYYSDSSGNKCYAKSGNKCYAIKYSSGNKCIPNRVTNVTLTLMLLLYATRKTVGEVTPQRRPPHKHFKIRSQNGEHQAPVAALILSVLESSKQKNGDMQIDVGRELEASE